MSRLFKKTYLIACDLFFSAFLKVLVQSEHIQGAPIKNNPLEKMLYFSHGSMDSSQTFIIFM